MQNEDELRSPQYHQPGSTSRFDREARYESRPIGGIGEMKVCDSEQFHRFDSASMILRSVLANAYASRSVAGTHRQLSTPRHCGSPPTCRTW